MYGYEYIRVSPNLCRELFLLTPPKAYYVLVQVVRGCVSVCVCVCVASSLCGPDLRVWSCFGGAGPTRPAGVTEPADRSGCCPVGLELRTNGVCAGRRAGIFCPGKVGDYEELFSFSPLLSSF